MVMGSKRTKKAKQDVEIFTENDIKPNNENILESGISNVTTVSNNVPAVPKAPKRKKKSEGTEVPKKVKKRNEGEAKKASPRKRRIKSDIISIENEENKQVVVNGESGQQIVSGAQKNNKTVSPEKKKDEISWPDQDIVELINRMESNIPEKDALAYRSRVEKLNWNIVSFKNYDAEECKKTWNLVQKRIRRFRLLREVLNDAKEWLSTPRANHKLPRERRKKHPDMPRRPLSSYLLFYFKKKDEVISEHPGLDASDLTKLMGQIYKNLPPETREKYDQMAAANKEEYMTKLKTFFENHPEIVPPQRFNLNHKPEKKPVKIEKEKMPVAEKVSIKVEEKEKKEKPQKVEKAQKVEKEKPLKVEKDKPPKVEKEKPPKVEKEKPPKVARERTKSDKKPGRPPKLQMVDRPDRPPKKFQTPFGLYLASELKNMEVGTDKGGFREKCKQQYKTMSDKKKVLWINLAEQDLIRYEEEVKTYKAKYPDYKVQKIRSILTKGEKASKERAAGKPVKPPNSAYALYSRVFLQSEEIKSVHPKDRMNYIANKWKTVPEEEQASYKDQVVVLMQQYKQEYQEYVDSLPEEERTKILQQSSKRKGIKTERPSSAGRTRKPRKRKSASKPQPVKSKFVEPEQPPISACKYFATLHKGEGDPVQVWKSLSPDEKRKYEDELVKKKQAYIIEFEKFLKSLSKEELEAFSKSRQQQVQSDDDSSECSSGSEGDGEDEEDDEGDADGDERNEENGEVHNNEDDAHNSDSE